MLPVAKQLRPVQMPELRVDARCLDSHRAVEKNLPSIEAPFGVVFRHQVQQVLGASDGECRDQHIAAALRGVVKNRSQFPERRFERAMIAIAVCAFEQNEIGVGDRRRVVHHGRRGVAQVAAEDELATLAQVLDRQFDDRRAEDVAGFVQANLNARQDLLLLYKLEADELLHDSCRIVLRVERLDRRHALAAALPVLPVGVFLVQVRGIPQHDCAQRARRSVSVDRPLVALPRQQGQPAGMVYVRVAQHDGVDAVRRDR